MRRIGFLFFHKTYFIVMRSKQFSGDILSLSIIDGFVILSHHIYHSRHVFSELMRLFILSVLSRWGLDCLNAWSNVVLSLDLIFWILSLYKSVANQIFLILNRGVVVPLLFLSLAIIIILSYSMAYRFGDFFGVKRTVSFLVLLLF